MKHYPQALFVLVVIFFSTIAIRQESSHPTPRILMTKYITDSSVLAETATLAPYHQEFFTTNEEPSPKLKINAALVKDAIGSQVFYRLNADERWPLASLTKLMTATVALENLPTSEERDTLIKRMMVISNNAAADALANMLGFDQWIALMNTTATRLGMTATGFTDAQGVSYLNQSTAGDIGKLVAYILQRHPNIFAWSTAKSITIDDTIYVNINEFVQRPDFLGGKTGFTDEANGNLVTIFKTARGPIVFIVLGTPDKLERFIQTEKLFTWLSRHFKL